MAIGKTTGKALADGIKGWLIASVVVLLGSLTLFVITVVAGFVYFTQTNSPLWVTVLGVISVLGILLGFGGLFMVLVLASVRSSKAEKMQAALLEREMDGIEG